MAKTSSSVGYHVSSIPQGENGELSKIQEELSEAHDAKKQKCELMVLLELSDVLGAVELYLKKHHPSLTIHDLLAMSSITSRAFESGHRQEKPQVTKKSSAPKKRDTSSTQE